MNLLSWLIPSKVPVDMRTREQILLSKLDKMRNENRELENILKQKEELIDAMRQSIEYLSPWIPYEDFVVRDHIHDDLIALMPSGAVVRFNYQSGREYLHPHAFHGGKLIGMPKAIQVLKYSE